MYNCGALCEESVCVELTFTVATIAAQIIVEGRMTFNYFMTFNYYYTRTYNTFLWISRSSATNESLVALTVTHVAAKKIGEWVEDAAVDFSAMHDREELLLEMRQVHPDSVILSLVYACDGATIRIMCRFCKAWRCEEERWLLGPGRDACKDCCDERCFHHLLFPCDSCASSEMRSVRSLKTQGARMLTCRRGGHMPGLQWQPTWKIRRLLWKSKGVSVLTDATMKSLRSQGKWMHSELQVRQKNVRADLKIPSKRWSCLAQKKPQ